MREERKTSFLNSGSSPFLEALYDEYLSGSKTVPEPWKGLFDEMAGEDGGDVSHAPVREAVRRRVRERPRAAAAGPSAAGETPSEKQAAVSRMIHAYRLNGHLCALTDPIRLREPQPVPDLDPAFQGLSDSDLDVVFNTGTMDGPREAPLRDILQALRDTYCGPVGAEFVHIHDNETRLWIQHRLERSRSRPHFPPLFKRYILEQLTAAEGLERYLHVKYAGQKRFSLEGAESLIPLLDALIQHAGSSGVREIAIGMAHRGRLNVLANIMGKAPKDIFIAFEGGKGDGEDGTTTRGDVKYHEGFSSDAMTPGGPVHLALAFNPSHLEIIDPVVLGSVRARQDRSGEGSRNEVFGVLVHGDAALAGQGVVYETLNLSQTRGFSTGGTIHIVVNNRIGFTLSNPRDLHSTMYCTDVGKVVQAPIFHVNADDPEAVAFVTQLAVEYRMTFHRDVMIDLICYRRHGHNEADEPAVTQPMMYRKVRKHPGTRQVYADRLIREQVVTETDVTEMMEIYRQELEEGRPVSENRLTETRYGHQADWTPFLKRTWTEPYDSGIPADRVRALGHGLTTFPEGFKLHPRVAKIMDERRKMAEGGQPIDWGCAENLAYASLLTEGHPVRLTGQDSARGTFFHRHALVYNQANGKSHLPLARLEKGQARFVVVDSILSEEAVLGFEYGYSTTQPDTLVVWEAQYGDFANGAQVVIDQFISSSEQKWRRLSGLVMMLPHGWEGQGPEHSSARLERYLQLCALENMQVCVPTSPAQMFHLLRREVVRPYRKPLVIMSPKGMLRKKRSFSTVEDLGRSGYRLVLPDLVELDPGRVRRVLLCCGKVYYDLVQEREDQGLDQVVALRVEQLYPFPGEALQEALAPYTRATEVVWVQEEPQNQGAWQYVQPHVRRHLRPDQSLSYAGRLDSASPAGGDYQKHMERQTRLVRAALNLKDEPPYPILEYAAREPAPLRHHEEVVEHAG